MRYFFLVFELLFSSFVGALVAKSQVEVTPNYTDIGIITSMAMVSILEIVRQVKYVR